MNPKKINIDNLFILGAKTIMGYFVFIVFFFAVPIYKDAKAVLSNATLGMYADRIVVGESAIGVQIVDSTEERVRGLSGTKSLAENTGMFFVFDTPDYHGIWMKDMKFSIDILWLDTNKEVIFIKENVSPETYPESFRPTKKALYVLEVPAGFVKKNGIKIGDRATSL